MKTPAAIPGGGGTWKNSSLKFLTADGYLSPKEAARNLGELDDATGTSIFDPVLCELVYRWFCPPDGAVLDPFAGGSVRGIVAAMLGRQYMGVDLSARQIEANVV